MHSATGETTPFGKNTSPVLFRKSKTLNRPEDKVDNPIAGINKPIYIRTRKITIPRWRARCAGFKGSTQSIRAINQIRPPILASINLVKVFVQKKTCLETTTGKFPCGLESFPHLAGKLARYINCSRNE